MSFGCPGVGGSLGQCALCGNTFLLEILTGATVKELQSSGFEGTLYAHHECIKTFMPGDGIIDLKTLPDKSPLRQAYEAQNK